jgi:glycosyltransferase involved in cell wall biosynthesis
MGSLMQLGLSCTAGNPTNPRTWSGTPHNLLEAFTRAGVTVIPFDTSIQTGTLLNRIGMRFFRHPELDYQRSLVARWASARRIRGVDQVLHTTSLDLPPFRIGSTQHYLFCDSTWNLSMNLKMGKSNLSDAAKAQGDANERRVYGQVSHFFPISEYVKQDLIAHYGIDPARITVVGTGRGKITPYTGDKRDYAAGHILMVAKGRFEDKGGTLLLDAFRLAHAQNPALRLIITGRVADWHREKIEATPGATFEGFVPWERLQELFNTASLYAMPAPDEPWGLVYLEALACRTPILGLRRNAMPELTGHGQYGIMVDAPDPRLVADAILDAFAHPERLRAMGEAGQRFCLDTFSWDNTVRRILDTITDTITDAGKPEAVTPDTIKDTIKGNA